MQQAEERLSAFVDDELEGPAGALLERLVDDPAQRERWARYHLVGEVLRNGTAPDMTGFRSRVASAIADEPTLLVPPVTLPAARRQSRVAPQRWALAAGFGAAAVLGAALVARAPVPADPPLAIVTEPAAVPAGLPADLQGGPLPQQVAWDEQGRPAATLPEALEFHRRLNGYLVNFNEQRASLGVPGVHPYVRIVGFDEAAGNER